jgi:hypothetical protein
MIKFLRNSSKGSAKHERSANDKKEEVKRCLLKKN